MNKVVFLDRDGVINFEPRDYTFEVNKFKIIDGLFESLKILKLKGYLFIVITNQGGISKQLYSHNDVNSVHLYMQRCFEQAEIDLLDIYYCPHHAINEKCICRKPDSLMLEKAIARYNIDITKSYFIGDSRRDILAAEKVGLTGVQIEMNDSLKKYISQIN
ncbi:MAG: D,D-heptose 1,7-bisphosphate phosphatase [Flavobacteriales bacterium]|nr:MAG: D,D-heptose 1,7-bisphosphate phosphatase [Flavobacteriales bacterium]